MESLRENRPLLYSIIASITAVICLVSGFLPDMAAQFSIVEFPSEFQNLVLGVLATDMISAFVLDRILDYFLGRAKLRE